MHCFSSPTNTVPVYKKKLTSLKVKKSNKSSLQGWCG